KTDDFGMVSGPNRPPGCQRAPRPPPHRLRHRRPDRARRAARRRAERGRPRHRRGPGTADGGQGAASAGAGRAGGRIPRRRRRLSAGARSRGDQPGRGGRGDGRPARHDRMQPARRHLRHRGVVQRARQLAAHQRRGRRRPTRRQPRRDARAAGPAPRAQGHPRAPGRRLKDSPDMNTAVENAEILQQLGRRYDAGFVTDIDSDSLPPGLSEDIIRALSAKKEEPEWMTEWRLAAYRHWLTMPVPQWAKLKIGPIDFQAISYYSAPKGPKYKSLDEVPQELLDT